MGLVKVDKHKAEKQFERISFSDIDCIKGLIKNRWMIDKYMDLEHIGSIELANDVQPINQELIITYIDLQSLIKKANLNVKQRFIVNKLMEGYTEKDVADMFQQTESNINQTFDKIAEKIKKVNDLQWKYDYVYMNYIKSKWNFKRCKKCNNFKPATNDFYNTDKKNKDGYMNICKACR